MSDSNQSDQQFSSEPAYPASRPSPPGRDVSQWAKLSVIVSVLLVVGAASYLGWIQPTAGVSQIDRFDRDEISPQWESHSGTAESWLASDGLVRPRHAEPSDAPRSNDHLLIHRGVDLARPGEFTLSVEIAVLSRESAGGIAFHIQPPTEPDVGRLDFYSFVVRPGERPTAQFRRHEGGDIVRVVSEQPLPFSISENEFLRYTLTSPSAGQFRGSVTQLEPRPGAEKAQTFSFEISDSTYQDGGAGLYAADEEVAFRVFDFQLGEHFGYWSLLPPLIAILLAFWLREVITALIVGIFLGGIIVGDINVIQAYLLPSVGTSGYAMILLVYLWALGGLIGIWTRTAGATYFANWAAERMVVGRRSAKLFTWMMGLVFHQGGTISTVLTGATVRSIGDRNRVSHEELSYLVDSTASPAAALIPFNVWPIYIAGIVAGTIPLFTSSLAGEAARKEQELSMGVSFFIGAIPFNFFAIFAILLTFLLAIEKLPWMGGRMKAAIERVKTTGELDRPGAVPMSSAELTELHVPSGYRPGLIDFFGPIGTLLGIAVIPYIIMVPILGRDFSMMIAEAFVLAVLAGFAIALIKGMPLRIAMEGFITGCKGVTIGALILALAVTLKSVGDSVGVAIFITGAFEEILHPAMLPALFMLLCMLIAFSTGTSFGTYAIVFPIAMPLAWVVGGESVFFITICFSSVVGGALFGDKCSPISDTTILSSLSTGCDLMDHVYTQLPLALAAAFASMILYTALVFFAM